MMFFFVAFGHSVEDRFHILQPGETSSFIGSYIIGSNDTIETTTKLDYYLNDKLVSTENKTLRNPLGIFGYEYYRPDDAVFVENRTTTEIKCASKHPCKIHSYQVSGSRYQKFAGKVYEDYDEQSITGYHNYVETFSTKKKGNFRFNLYHKIDNSSTPKIYEYEGYNLYVLGENQKKFRLMVQKGISANCYFINTTINIESDEKLSKQYFRIESQTMGYFEYVARVLDCNMHPSSEGSGNINTSMTILWEEIAQVNADDYSWKEGEKMLIPEFEAKLPAEAGVFTLDNISQENTIQPTPTANPQEGKTTLSGGAIAGIVIGIIVVVACIVGVCLWLFVLRKQKEEDNNEEEP